MNFKNRHKYLGASEVGQALGLSKWGTTHDLWLQKTLRSPRTAHKHIFDRGHEMEPILARMLEDRYGFHLHGAQAQYSREETRFLRSHVDGIMSEVPTNSSTLGSDVLLDSSGALPSGEGVIEYKAPGMHVTREVKTNGFDASYIAQLQTNIYNADAQWGALVILDYDAWCPLVAWMRRDDEMIKAIIERTTEFWQRVERDDEPPIGLPPAPMPNFYPGGAKEITDPAATTLAASLFAATTEKDSATDRYDTLKERFLLHMRDNENSSKVTVPLSTVTMRVTDSLVKGRESIQAKDLLEWTRNLCDAYIAGEKDIVQEMVGKFVNRPTPLFVKKGQPYVRTTINFKENKQ